MSATKGAIEFWQAGRKVFGLYGADKNGRCLCGNPKCQAAYKHPISSSWQHTPHWADDQLEVAQMAGQFNTGYGVLVDDLLVIDVDARNGGVESYQRLIEAIPEIQGAGLIVDTGSGECSKHLYFSLAETIPLLQHHSDYPGIDFKSSGFVVGPGSMHKSGNEYKTVVGSPYDISQAPSGLIDMLRKPERYRAEMHGAHVDVSEQDIASMLGYVPADCDYETWVRCGMAVHHATGGCESGLAIWNAWSTKGTKYPGASELEKKWHGFGKSGNPVTLGTLAHYAEQHGWKQPVEFHSDIVFDYEPTSLHNMDDVDLKRPPGFVGRVVDWINSQCIFPRENLAVAAALTCVSNVAGMRYFDELEGATPNLFVFGVAGSATGKEAVLKAHNELMRGAGLSAAVHGGIKSEQEIYRNMTRHQGVFYVVDELGEQLAKVTNAMKRGTASYLEGVVGTLMSAYSKANSFMLITGDLKEDVRASIKKERSAMQKMLDNGESKHSIKLEEKLNRLDYMLADLDEGIKNPYVSILGLTTPEKFNLMMDEEMAMNGFMGRSLIFQELEDNPRRKPRGRPCSKAEFESICAALRMLYAPGYSELPDRVECVGDKVSLQTRPDAAKLMDEVGMEFWNIAEKHKQQTGLSSIPRRGYEQVAKISMVLAIPEGLRTVEHVRWAYRLVCQDVQGKLLLANANSATDALDALASRIMSMVTTEHGETKERIVRRCRRYSRGDVDKALGLLVKAGHLRSVTESTGSKGRPATNYFATGAKIE